MQHASSAPYFAVNITMMQNTGAPMQMAVSEFVDPLNDGVCISKWPRDKDKDTTDLLVTVTVVGIALFTPDQS